MCLQLRPVIAVVYMTVFCAVSPIGIGIGMALTDPAQQDNINTSALIAVQVGCHWSSRRRRHITHL